MIFPRLKFWSSESRSESDPDLIHRSLENRQHRLCAGISVDQKFQKIHGCLAVLKGRGRFSKLKYATGASIELSASLQKGCEEICGSEKPNTFDLQFLLQASMSIEFWRSVWLTLVCGFQTLMTNRSIYQCAIRRRSLNRQVLP